MGFRYTRAPKTQNILLAFVLLAWFGIAATSYGVAGWQALSTRFSEPALVVGGLWVLHQVVFWAVCGFYLVVDHTDRPAFIARYRIQDGPVRRPPTGRILRVLAVNQLVLFPLLLWGTYAFLKWRGWSVSTTLPRPLTVVWQLAVMGLLSVVLFYIVHRFLHRKWWMAKVHRVHHEFRSTSAWSGEYAHPVEFVFGNFLALAGGVWVLAPSVPVMYLYSLLSMLTFLVHHSGYAVPWAPSPVHHDWHHFRYSELFGTTGLLDRLLSTDRDYRTLKHGDYRP